MTRIAFAFVTVFAFVLSTHAQTSTLEAYLVLHGAFVIEGKQPDGDSIRFRPNQPELLQKLKRANRIEPSKDGTVQLRLEGIDAPELHYENVAQPFSKEPRNALLSWFGFSSVTYTPKGLQVKTGRGSRFGMPELESASRQRRALHDARRVARKTTPCALLIFDPVLEADTPVLFGMKFSPEDTDRIIMMAWEDRTPFEAIEAQFGLKEKDVREFMRQVQSKKTYIRWRERVEGRITKLGKMRSKEVQRSRPVRCRCWIKKRHKSDNQKF